MHKYVTRQRVLFEHRVQELSGAETSLKNAEEGMDHGKVARRTKGASGARTPWGMALIRVFGTV